MRIAYRHIAPNIASPLIAHACLRFAGTLLSVSGLSFLGLGVQPPTPEWGAMVSDGRACPFGPPHLVLAPAVAVVLTASLATALGRRSPRQRERSQSCTRCRQGLRCRTGRRSTSFCCPASTWATSLWLATAPPDRYAVVCHVDRHRPACRVAPPFRRSPERPAQAPKRRPSMRSVTRRRFSGMSPEEQRRETAVSSWAGGMSARISPAVAAASRSAPSAGSKRWEK